MSLDVMVKILKTLNYTLNCFLSPKLAKSSLKTITKHSITDIIQVRLSCYDTKHSGTYQAHFCVASS